MNTPIQQSLSNENRTVWSKLGLGTGTLASLGRAASLTEVHKLLVTMLSEGATVIDTADSYGSGDCEILLGKALRSERSSFTVVTKAGYRLSNLPEPLRPLNQFIKKAIQKFGIKSCHEPIYLAYSLDQSLKRLKMDHVDTFLLHDPSLETVNKREVIQACDKIKREGKAIFTGVSSGIPEVIEAAIAAGVFEVIQTPANLKIANIMKPIWDRCASSGIHLIANHVFDPSCLSHQGMSHEKLMRTSAALMPSSTTLLCGTRNLSHLREANEWANRPFSKAEAEKILRMIHS